MMGRLPAKAPGVVLAELLVVLAISAVMLALALPDFAALLRGQQVRAAVADLAGALALTRAQALARADRVELVPLDPAGSDWSRGWVVLVDRDGDRRPSAGDEIIAVHAALPPGIALSVAFSSHQRPDYIAFNSVGRACRADSALAARFGTLTLRADGEQRKVIVNMLGRIRVCDPARDGASCAGDGAP
jgi:type IV fimbrial biogenesis protein FimT